VADLLPHAQHAPHLMRVQRHLFGQAVAVGHNNRNDAAVALTAQCACTICHGLDCTQPGVGAGGYGGVTDVRTAWQVCTAA
jgi:hypothetical protein